MPSSQHKPSTHLPFILGPDNVHPEEQIKELLRQMQAEYHTANKENTQAAKSKRSFDVADLIDDIKPSDFQKFPITESCDQIRRKITTFLQNSGMKVKDFVETIGVSGVGYYRFMNQHGKDKGSCSDTYIQASSYFKSREAQGIPMPKKRKATKPLAETSTNVAGTKGTKGSKGAAAPAPFSIPIAHIELFGEKEDAVEVFDSCDEIRKKINAHLRKPNVTQAAFLRELHAQFHGPRKPSSLSAAQLNTFRGHRGPTTGNQSGIFYAAYVYFEKERIAAGRPKSQHRLDMEDVWSLEGGLDLSRNLNSIGYFCSANSRVYMDSLGQARVYH